MPPVKEYKKANSKARKTPKKSKATAKLTQSNIKKTPKSSRNKSTDSLGSRIFDKSFDTPGSTCGIDSQLIASNFKKETPYSIYSVKRWRKSGGQQFSKSLLRYFMKIDSPAAYDLKSKRFNTSFWHETPRYRDIQIFSPEEDNDPKWSANVPEITSNLPETPGSQYTDVFKSIPIDCYSDNESDILINLDRKKENAAKRIKSERSRPKFIRCTGFNGKPLPEQSLLFNCSDTNHFEPDSNDDAGIKEKELFSDSIDKKDYPKGTLPNILIKQPEQYEKNRSQPHSNLLSTETEEKNCYKYNENQFEDNSEMKTRYNLRSRKREQK